MHSHSFIQSYIHECELPSFIRTHAQRSTCENKAGGDPSQSQPKHRQEAREHLGREQGEGGNGGWEKKQEEVKRRSGVERREASDAAALCSIQMGCLDRQMTFSESNYLQSEDHLHPVENSKSENKIAC